MAGRTAFQRDRRCLALSGGVGGAKLCLGLAQLLPPSQLLLVANTADDFEHLGLHISPDLDTLMYTLAGRANSATGWGRVGDTWSFMTALAELGGETWFRLGDLDLATHIERTRRLLAGESLSDVTADLCRRLGVPIPIAPMSDDAVRTVVRTPKGELPFQHYFVRDACRPEVLGFRFAGIETATMSDGLRLGLHDPRLGAVVICPSNPLVSVDPILALSEVTEVLRACGAPVIAVSPIVAGQAIKGPAAKMMKELEMPVSAVGVARHYVERDLLTGFVLDRQDEHEVPAIEALGIPALVTNTVMVSLEDRIDLAREVLNFAVSLEAD